jgi:hypothetical protein
MGYISSSLVNSGKLKFKKKLIILFLLQPAFAATSAVGGGCSSSSIHLFLVFESLLLPSDAEHAEPLAKKVVVNYSPWLQRQQHKCSKFIT